MLKILIVEDGQTILDESVPAKVFSSGRKGYFRNGKIVVNGVNHGYQLQVIGDDPTKQRSGETDESFQARLTEIKAKAAGKGGRNGKVRTITPPTS